MNFPLISEYAIDTAVPIPDPRGGLGKLKYPFPMMNVGDSFFVPGRGSQGVKGSINYWNARGRKFTTRTRTENGVYGVRVWRVE